MNDEDENELQNPFPSPPSHYANYTSHNLNLLATLRERCPDPDATDIDQHQILSDQTDIPDFPLTMLEKPRVDWILDDPEGYYDVFGDRWFAKEKIPSLEELGGTQLYPPDPSTDRRPALKSILRSMLVTYSYLAKALLDPPPTASTTAPPEWQRHVEWLMILSQNLMAATNDLRPVQARENLENMMKHQLELRKEETKAIHQKCDELEATLSQLRSSAKDVVQSSMVEPVSAEAVKPIIPTVSTEEVLRWAEEVG